MLWQPRLTEAILFVFSLHNSRKERCRPGVPKVVGDIVAVPSVQLRRVHTVFLYSVLGMMTFSCFLFLEHP